MLGTDLIGVTLADRYEILSVIGHGGMGSVYKARHVLLDKYVAVKILQPRFLTDPSNLERFKHEAKAVSSLMHSNIVSVIDYGVSDQEAPFLVMDYLEGVTLAELIRRENYIEENRAAKIFLQIARALSHIHSRGVLHRDLKPGNIMLLNNESETDLVKIMDFGISRRSEFKEEGNEITQRGKLVGSPLYMSPEQCLGRDLDARSDLYSFGCLMYETLIGMPPLAGETPIQTVFQHVHENPLPFKKMRPAIKVSSDLESVVLRALEKEPKNRYQSAKELTNDLELFTSGVELKTVLASNKAVESERETSAKGERDAERLERTVIPSRSRQVLWTAPFILLLSLVCLSGIIFVSLFTATGSIVKGKIELILASTLLRANDERILQEVNKLADICMENQHYQDALPLYEQAAALTEKKFGTESPEAVLAHCKCVQTCLKKDGLLAATKMFDADIAPVFPKLFKQLMNAGKNLEIANLATAVLDLQKLLHMEPCLDATGMYDLASCYQRIRMYDMAGPLYEKALYVARWSNGGKSALVGAILMGTGDLHSLTGKCPQAVMEYKEALTIFKSGTLENLVCQLHMANAESARGHNEDAEALYKRVLALEEARGLRDKKIAREMYLHYAAMLKRNQRVAEGKQLEKRAAGIPETQPAQN